MNAFQYGQDKTMCKLSVYFSFNNATDEQADIKHDKVETLSSMSLSMNRSFRAREDDTAHENMTGKIKTRYD